MFCGPETVDVEGPQNILLSEVSVNKYFIYTECQKRRKVPQINQTCVKRITFYLTWLREALWICCLPVNKSNVHRLATLPGRQ